MLCAGNAFCTRTLQLRLASWGKDGGGGGRAVAPCHPCAWAALQALSAEPARVCAAVWAP